MSCTQSRGSSCPMLMQTVSRTALHSADNAINGGKLIMGLSLARSCFNIFDIFFKVIPVLKYFLDYEHACMT